MNFVGTLGNDTFAGGMDNDTASGHAGHDTLVGGDGDDLLLGNDGDDVLGGGWDNDTLSGGAGLDELSGDNGDDLLQDLSGGSRQAGGLGYDTLHGGADADTLDGGDQDDSLNGGAGADVLWDGNVFNPASFGAPANDTLRGADGDDAIYSLAGRDLIDGGDGFDSLFLDRSYLSQNLMINMALAATVGGVVLGEGTSVRNVERSEIHTGAGNDSFWGGQYNDRFLGGTGADVAAGGGGNDALVGEAGNDQLIGDSGNDRVDGGDGQDWLSGGAGNDTILGGAGDDTVSYAAAAAAVTVDLAATAAQATGGDGTDMLRDIEHVIGSAYGDQVRGTAGGNGLDGGAGADTLTGGLGDDTYWVDDVSDRVVEAHNEGDDRIVSSVTYSLNGRAVETLILTGTAAIDGSGNSLDNVITGNSGDNRLDGSAGNDTLTGGLGDDTYVVQSSGDKVMENHYQGTDLVMSGITYSLFGKAVENLVLTGTANTNGTGNSLDNVITGNSGDNRLDGKDGIDTLSGGLGDDTYLVNTLNDVVIEADGQGYDRVISSSSYSLAGRAVEVLQLTGSRRIDGTGNGLDNLMLGNSGRNRLDGGAGNDTLTGGVGNDTYVVDAAGDVVTEVADQGTDLVMSSISYTLGSQVENLTLSGSGNVNGTGNTLNNLITGNSGINVLAGGLSNDTYVVHNLGDVVIESVNEGIDTIVSYVNYVLTADNVEKLMLGQGTADLTATGSVRNDDITGNGGDNVIDGGFGADTMRGGTGNDTFYVDHGSDEVWENFRSGSDTVISQVSYTLLIGSYVETLELAGSGNINATGNSFNNRLIGNSGQNVLTGGSGDDYLEGGLGADTLIGGFGADTYVLDSVLDVVNDGANDGWPDTVIAGFTYTLGSTVENLVLTGSANINGTGNNANNVLTGNAGLNVLAGGNGNDIYYIQNEGDTVIEVQGRNTGSDRVYSTVSYSIANTAVESLTLEGSGDINATGNSLSNSLRGNNGVNVLTGGAGDDRYYIQTVGDVVVEADGQGFDRVYSSVSFDSTGIFVEVITLTGDQAVNVIGGDNAANQWLVGNSAANRLEGRGGRDAYNGGGGADTFVFGPGSGQDDINDFHRYENDRIDVHAYTNGVANELLVGQSFNNVVIDFGGGNRIWIASVSVADVLSQIIW